MTGETVSSTEARELRALLAAVREAFALPFDTADYDRRLVTRVGWSQTVVAAVLDNPSEDIGWNAGFLRSKLAAEQAEAEQQAVRRSVDRAFPAVAAFLATERGAE